MYVYIYVCMYIYMPIYSILQVCCCNCMYDISSIPKSLHFPLLPTPGFWSTKSVLFNRTVLEKAICAQAVPFETSPLDSSNFSRPCLASTSATTLSTMKVRCTCNVSLGRMEAFQLPQKVGKCGKIPKTLGKNLQKYGEWGWNRMENDLIHPRCQLFFVWHTHLLCSHPSYDESNQWNYPGISHCRWDNRCQPLRYQLSTTVIIMYSHFTRCFSFINTIRCSKRVW